MTTKTKRWLSLAIGLVAVLTIGSFPAFAHSSIPLVAAAVAVATPFATQVKILAISGSVYLILQAVKTQFNLSGILAVILNVVISGLGVVTVIKPEDLFSLPTVTTLAIAALTAAGAHGTVRSFSGGSSTPANPAGTTVAALLAFALITLTGCSSLERTAYNIIVGSKAFTQNISDKHPECGTRDASGHWVPDPNNHAGVCVALAKGIAAKDVLIDAAEEYCAGPDFISGGACNAPTSKTVKDQLAAKVQAAITGYEQTETDIRALLK